jgi:hypothetical protein
MEYLNITNNTFARRLVSSYIVMSSVLPGPVELPSFELPSWFNQVGCLLRNLSGRSE